MPTSQILVSAASVWELSLKHHPRQSCPNWKAPSLTCRACMQGRVPSGPARSQRRGGPTGGGAGLVGMSDGGGGGLRAAGPNPQVPSLTWGVPHPFESLSVHVPRPDKLSDSAVWRGCCRHADPQLSTCCPVSTSW